MKRRVIIDYTYEEESQLNVFEEWLAHELEKITVIQINLVECFDTSLDSSGNIFIN